MSFPLLIGGLQLASGAAHQPPRRIGADQRDDQRALSFRDAWLAAGARSIAKPVESFLVEAMEALAHRLRVAPQFFGDLRGTKSIPALRAIIRARIIQSAGAWRLLASLRTFCSSTPSRGARARNNLGMFFGSFPYWW